MTFRYDVAVVGLGAMGSAALAFLASRGLRVIGIEARFPAHALGSSHGDSRIIRLGYHEDPSYVPLLRRAYRNWDALEARLRSEVLTVTGVLQIGTPDSRIVRGMLASCEMHGLAHEVLDRGAMGLRFPAFRLDDGEVGVLDPQGGYLRPELAVMGYLKLAAEDGAEMHFGEEITSISSGDAGVILRSRQGTYHAGKVIVATGSWIADLVPALRSAANPIRQVVAWYQPADPFVTSHGRMPCFLWDEGEGGSYFGFPAIGQDGVKFGRHAHFREPIDPHLDNPPVNEADVALLDTFAARRLPRAASVRMKSTTCRYTMLPSEDFLIDFVPGEPDVIVCSACSGHGFKFTSVIGEVLADLASEGGTSLPIEVFGFKRHFPAREAAAALS
jgi:sarcosine oxidase